MKFYTRPRQQPRISVSNDTAQLCEFTEGATYSSARTRLNHLRDVGNWLLDGGQLANPSQQLDDSLAFPGPPIEVVVQHVPNGIKSLRRMCRQKPTLGRHHTTPADGRGYHQSRRERIDRGVQGPDDKGHAGRGWAHSVSHQRAGPDL